MDEKKMEKDLSQQEEPLNEAAAAISCRDISTS